MYNYPPPQGTPYGSRPRRSALPWCIGALAVSIVAGAAMVANGIGPMSLVPAPRTVAVGMPVADLPQPAPTAQPQPAPTVTVQPAPRPTVTVTAPAPAAPKQQDMGPADGIDPDLRDVWEATWSTMSYSEQSQVCALWEDMPELAWDSFDEGASADGPSPYTFPVFAQLIEESCS